MNLYGVRELRQELEAIEATMERIKDLWLSSDFPSADNFEDLARAVGEISSEMDSIQEKTDELPTADEFDDLGGPWGASSGAWRPSLRRPGKCPRRRNYGPDTAGEFAPLNAEQEAALAASTETASKKSP